MIEELIEKIEYIFMFCIFVLIMIAPIACLGLLWYVTFAIDTHVVLLVFMIIFDVILSLGVIVIEFRLIKELIE